MPATRGPLSLLPRHADLLCALLVLGACRPTNSSSAPGAEAAGSRNPFADQPYADAPLPPEAKVFLVAGGDDVANFAADVMEQRALWIQAGLREEEIACYYAKPTRAARRDDAEQYEFLAPLLRRCYAADPRTLHAHLREAASRGPDFLYLFVSAHGLPPLLRWKAGVDDPNALPGVLELQPGEIGRFDHHAIGLEAGEGPKLGQVNALLQAHREGELPEALVFTPTTLAAALEDLPVESELIVVLQACFSGGFIGRPQDDGPSVLTERARTTVLTASSSRRPSFGCSPGTQRTYYGGAFNRVLASVFDGREDGQRLPPALPWAEIHARVRFIVETMEAIDGEESSEPGYFSNVPGRESRPPNTERAEP